MRINISFLRSAALVFAVAASLSACGNVSKNVHANGQAADGLVWPKISDTTPMHKGGTFPGRDSLARVHAGLNKQEIADLIGFPHFSEGVWGVREWNYVFNFRDPAHAESVVTCQFKILFDEQKIAQSFYWSPAPCGDFQQPQVVNEPVSQSPASKPVSKPVSSETFTFASDALFAFGRSTLDDITGDGHARLDKLASNLHDRAGQLRTIRVVGYTDRLGSDAYNQALSLHRADTIKGYLAMHGLDPSIISTQGLGKQNPLRDCAETERNALIACLAPNRRVEIEVSSVLVAQKAD